MSGQAGGFRNLVPTAILAQAISAVVDEPASSSQLQRFIPAANFQGSKPGYYFARGPTGLGWVPGACLPCNMCAGSKGWGAACGTTTEEAL
jgi:hypothetical protein